MDHQGLWINWKFYKLIRPQVLMPLLLGFGFISVPWFFFQSLALHFQPLLFILFLKVLQYSSPSWTFFGSSPLCVYEMSFLYQIAIGSISRWSCSSWTLRLSVTVHWYGLYQMKRRFGPDFAGVLRYFYFCIWLIYYVTHCWLWR